MPFRHAEGDSSPAAQNRLDIARRIGARLLLRRPSRGARERIVADLIGWFGRRGIYYGWVIVAVTFLTLFI